MLFLAREEMRSSSRQQWQLSCVDGEPVSGKFALSLLQRGMQTGGELSCPASCNVGIGRGNRPGSPGCSNQLGPFGGLLDLDALSGGVGWQDEPAIGFVVEEVRRTTIL